MISTNLSIFKKALLLAAVSASCATALAQTKWDLPSAYPASNFHTENLTQFVQDVDKATSGKLKITVHPNAALYKAPEIKRAVQGGQAQAGEVLLGNFQNEWQPFGIDGIPFLADSYASARKLYEAQKPVLTRKLGEQNMLLLYTVPWQPQGIYSKKPLQSVADLKGIKWRAYSPATSRIAELALAQPVTVQAAELSQALATGVVESFMTSSATGYDAKVFEHVKHYYATNAWLPKNAVLVNKAAFEALDKPTQEAVMRAAAAAEQRGWQLSEQKEREYIDLLKKNGMQVLEPTAAMKADLRKIGDTMLTEWVQKAGPDGQAIVDAYRKR